MRVLVLILSLIFISEAFTKEPAPIPFNTYVALGLVKGWSVARVHGSNIDVDTTTLPETVWAGGGDYSFPSVAAETVLVSDSANDTSGGSGCTAVKITGLADTDSDGDPWDLTTETIVLTGTTPATASTEFFRINELLCIASGSTNENEGNIDAKHGATVISRIPFSASVGHGKSQQGVYSVPKGYKWLVDRFSVTLFKNGAAAGAVHADIRPSSTNTWQTVLEVGVMGSGSSQNVTHPPEGRPFVIPEKTDVRLQVVECDTNNTEFNVNIPGILVDVSTGYQAL